MNELVFTSLHKRIYGGPDHLFCRMLVESVDVGQDMAETTSSRGDLAGVVVEKLEEVEYV